MGSPARATVPSASRADRGPAGIAVPRIVAQAIVFHLATRALTVLALLAAARHKGQSVSATFTKWDGRWYGIISQHWYPDRLPTADGHVVTNPAGFFPLLPVLIRPVTALGVPYAAAVAVEVLLFSTIAAALIAMVVRTYAPDRVALLTSCYWSVFPTASVLSVGYAEGLFTALASASLLFMLRGRWWWAAVACTLAGFTRPTGVVLVAAFLLAVVLAVRSGRATRRDLAAVLLASVGVVAALGSIAIAAHRWDAWFITEREGWGVRFDAGATLARWAYRSVVHPDHPVYLVFLAGVLAAVVLIVLAVRQRPPAPVQAYLVLGAVLALGQGGKFFLSPLRFLLPVFPLLVPAAQWTARRSAPVTAVLLGGAAVVSAGIGVYYFTVSGGAP